jgi:DNA-binding PadR family transcriptional regulator
MALSGIEGKGHRSDRIRKRYWALRFLYYRRKEPSSLYSVSREIEERMGITVRDQNLRIIIDGLLSRGLVERKSSTDSEGEYQITEYGIEWWERHGEALLQIM